MPRLQPLLIVLLLTIYSCSVEKKSEKELAMMAIEDKVAAIDQNHRIQIIEKDTLIGDSLYKVRGYMIRKDFVKVVGILRTTHYERDDYFYFDKHTPLFSGHMINFMDDKLAEEYKYYYKDGEIVHALFQEDHYVPSERFPSAHFKEIKPNQDSLIQSEKSRLGYLLHLLEMSSLEIKHLNENTGANN